MCFSATASFTAGVALSAVGGVTIGTAKTKSHKIFAATPLLFGVQQLTEGVIWLSFQTAAVLKVATFIYLLFSHVLWPTFIPFAILLMEPRRWRRIVLGLFAVIGLVVSAYFLYYLLIEPVKAVIINQCISYTSPHLSQAFILSPYSVATCASCLFSSHRFINLLGVVTFLSAIAAYQFYEHAFVSVWCFFAAILSVIIFVHFYTERRHSKK